MTSNSPVCDCGAPATMHDATGSFCEPCRDFVDLITRLIDAKIKRERGLPEDEARERKAAYLKNYNRTRRPQVRANWRRWSAKQPKGERWTAWKMKPKEL